MIPAVVIPLFSQECRTAERNAGPAIEVCSKDSSKVLSDLNTLSKNKESATKMSNKISVLAGTSSGRAAQARGRRQVPTNCSEVLAKVKVITEKLEANSKANVSTEVAEINNVTLAAGACSNIAGDLDKVKTRLNTVSADIGSLVEKLQKQLVG